MSRKRILSAGSDLRKQDYLAWKGRRKQFILEERGGVKFGLKTLGQVARCGYILRERQNLIKEITYR